MGQTVSVSSPARVRGSPGGKHGPIVRYLRRRCPFLMAFVVGFSVVLELISRLLNQIHYQIWWCREYGCDSVHSGGIRMTFHCGAEGEKLSAMR